MKSAKLNIGWSRIIDPEFETLAIHILDSMTANELFPSLQNYLPELKLVVKDFSNALAAAKSRGIILTAEKDNSRKILETLLTRLGLAIMSLSNNKTELLTTGFILRKEPETRLITKAAEVKLFTGTNAGEIISTTSSSKATICFMHQICIMEEEQLKILEVVVTTSSKYVFKNLQSGKKYSVKVASIGSKGQIVYSPVVSIYAQ